MNALELNALCKSFGAQRALADVSLSVPTGSRTVIVGPSGSGKTTLLRMIAGFEFPDTGSLTLNGQTLVDNTHAVPAHQRQIGYVPQDGALFPHMTVADNIGFGLASQGEARRERIAELMDSVALDANMARRWPHELSGGQQQRVALARALVGFAGLRREPLRQLAHKAVLWGVFAHSGRWPTPTAASRRP